MKCGKCGISGMEKPLYRTSPLGESNKVWLCENCLSYVPDPEVKTLADIIAADNKKLL